VTETARDAPMVLVVVGTDHHPFDRVVGWIDRWASDRPDVRVLIQYGTSSPPRVAEGFRLLPVDQLQRFLDEATVIVCHGGPGTIMGARESGHVPIVVPRRNDLGEHVDDHQLRFAARVERAGQVHLATDEATLAAMLESALDGDEGFRFDPDEDHPAERSVAEFGRLVAALIEGRRRAGR
jgi:UDP-N-acetylglucosamine transferase subunit ALG13